MKAHNRRLGWHGESSRSSKSVLRGACTSSQQSKAAVVSVVCSGNVMHLQCVNTSTKV